MAETIFGCSYCQEGKGLPGGLTEQTRPTETYILEDVMWAEGVHPVKINYCPICGKSLNTKTWMKEHADFKKAKRAEVK